MFTYVYILHYFTMNEQIYIHLKKFLTLRRDKLECYLGKQSTAG
jgi:hypothetical protein